MLFGFFPYELIPIVLSLLLWWLGRKIAWYLQRLPESMYTVNRVAAFFSLAMIVLMVGCAAAVVGALLPFVLLIWQSWSYVVILYVLVAAVAFAMNAIVLTKMQDEYNPEVC